MCTSLTLEQAILGEERSLLETAVLVSSAEVVVAAHGGQCYNLIFARPGTVFIEILPGQKSKSVPHGFPDDWMLSESILLKDRVSLGNMLLCSPI